ncbi:radical SAM protein [Brachyspira intermedia]|uniref:radical SAM/SPASM domain-containing protein n=1 Tax=Brachyspira intermedia TaxID=84377 RepID=UPI003005CED7
MNKVTIDKIAWWIPVKKWRDSFRNKLYDNDILYDKDNINMLEIEIFSYCNRKCWFCPNSIFDRHSKINYMPEETYLKILNDAKEFNNISFITYSRYNEPTADRIILKRIKQARKVFPNIWLTFNTNGDYLTKEYLDEFAEAGLNHMQIQCYLNENESFDVENIIKPRMIKLINKLDLKYEEIVNNNRIYELKLIYDKIDLRYQCRNFFDYGMNRGDTINKIKPYSRTEPCTDPSTNIHIDYNGNIMLCCNLRSDIEKHKKFIMGNVSNNTIKNIRNSKKFTNLMKILSKEGKKTYPCDTCKYGI